MFQLYFILCVRARVRVRVYECVFACECERVYVSAPLRVCVHSLISPHQSLNHEGRWGTTDDFVTSFLHFSLFSTALWDFRELKACPFPDFVFPPFPLSALSSCPFHCALQDSFGQT